MTDFSNPLILILFVAAIAIVSFAVSPRNITAEGFFAGTSGAGTQPGLWMLVLSQVTTWIFARSLMNAAILGYYYGIAGTLAYMAYYASFLTGMFVVGRMRERGAVSVQDWLEEVFGRAGTVSYNIIVALRLLSEVFANLIVVGLVFSAAYPDVENAGTIAVVVLALVGLVYSAMGGLRASLRTDVLQMIVFIVVLVVAFAIMVTGPEFSFSAIFAAEGASGSRSGWVLLAVAALQVFSYPVHDPVMMDRGFIADEKTTRNSFLHAFWISSACILAFGMFGIQAGIVGASYENQLLGTWSVMFGPFVYFLIAASLLVSAMSTLDSALASAARLVIEEWNWGARTILNGRIVMVAFMVGGALLTLSENTTLFDAVAVSGTASMFLTPVIIYALVLKRDVPLWSYLVAYAAALAGAAAYFFRSTAFVQALFEGPHKYDQLLEICVMVLAIGFLACQIGVRRTALR